MSIGDWILIVAFVVQTFAWLGLLIAISRHERRRSYRPQPDYGEYLLRQIRRKS